MPTPPREWSHRVEQGGDTYILSDDCESEPEAGPPDPSPEEPCGGERGGGCRAGAYRSGKLKLGLLKGTYRKTMRQIRCRLYKGINTKELDASLRFGAAQSKSWEQGPPATPPPAQRHEHSTVPAWPGRGGRAPARHDWAWGDGWIH